LSEIPIFRRLKAGVTLAASRIDRRLLLYQ
jgi:hypothetical protein